MKTKQVIDNLKILSAHHKEHHGESGTTKTLDRAIELLIGMSNRSKINQKNTTK